MAMPGLWQAERIRQSIDHYMANAVKIALAGFRPYIFPAQA